MARHEVRLLLVDDDPTAIQVMGRMLSQYPDQRFATSGEAALRLAREATPDLILLDVDMPGMTGFDVCEALKADPELAHVPVIFTTSHNSTALLQVAAFQKGGSDFVTKPLIAAQLTSRVRAHLRTKQLIEGLQRDSQATVAAPRPTGIRPPRLLIVDDDTASIHILRHTLAGMGDFHFAKNGEDALDLARRLLPDVILLDAHMAGIDGFEVCKTLKAEAEFRHVPIAFVTRFSDPRNEMRALDLGAADFIAKPYTRAVLQARVRNLLDLKRRMDAELSTARAHEKQVADTRLAEILDAASDAFITCETDGTVVLINAAACRMFGTARAQALGSPAQALLGDDAWAHSTAQDIPIRKTFMRTNGEGFPAEMTVSKVGEGSGCLTTVMLRDTSDRERLEAESRSRIEAETANRTRMLMLSSIAHEIGNPLNGMLGFARLMADDAEHPLATDQARRLAHIVTSGRHLHSLVRDVMDLGRIEAGKLAIELGSVDVVQCAQDAVAAVSAAAEQAGIKLSCSLASASIRCVADTGRLRQCLVNLLTNAVKYNRPGGWVRLEALDDSQGITIAVRDNGFGLDALQRQHLFEPFNRLGRQLAAAPGTGLGLFITHQLVGAMRGELRVESDPGSGSCFTIVLPAASGIVQESVELPSQALLQSVDAVSPGREENHE